MTKKSYSVNKILKLHTILQIHSTDYKNKFTLLMEGGEGVLGEKGRDKFSS